MLVKNGMTQTECKRCGDMYDPDDLEDGYCDDCRCGMYTCDNCGAWIDPDCDSYYSNDDGVIYCDDCQDELTFYCDYCNEYFPIDERRSDGRIEICEHCYNNYYQTCDCCGDLVHVDDAHYTHYECFCENCYEEVEENNNLHDYGYKPSPVFFRKEDEITQTYFGMEFEVDDGNSADNLSEDISHIPSIYCKGDGSLGPNGVEIVTHPMSYNYFCDIFPLNEIIASCRDNDYTSHDAGSCGMHVHISKKAFGNSLEDQERNIAKLLLIVDQNWGNIVKFSRRTESQLSSWCSRYTGIQGKTTEKEIIESAKDMNRSRYLCVNLQNSNTVELRVFRGSLKYNTIVATVQFCDILAKISLHSLEAIRNYNWEFIKKYAQRNGYTAFIRYCEERNI